MPLNRTFAGVWSMGWDYYANTLIICENISHQYNLDVSPANVMGGSGNMLIKSVGNADPTISIRGPMLFSYDGYSLSWGSPINGTPVVDAFIYSALITKQCWTTLISSLASDAFLSSDVALKNVNFTISDQGANVDTSWYLDFLSDNPNYVDRGTFPDAPGSEGSTSSNRGPYPAGEPWLTDNTLYYSNDLVPLRKGTWYDFVVRSGNKYYVIKDYSIKVAPDYDTLNPIGGYRHPLAGFDDMFWHVPIRIFKGAKVSVDMTSLIPINFGYPGWGRANLSYWGSGNSLAANNQRIATQSADRFYYESGDLQVDFRYPNADNLTGFNGYDIAATLLTGYNNISLVPVGRVNTQTSSSLQSGICEAKISFEYLLQPPSA